ncbi:MAG: preprotein translocase subunit SecG [bacterium]|nr:preprotein translocase subunit SecG [bacterium]
MFVLLVVLHVLVSIVLILIVLLQGGKGAEIGAAFGGASQTVFGSAGPTDFLGKLTTWSAAIFMVTSLSLAYLSSGKSVPSVVEKIPIATEQKASELPGAPAGIEQPLPPMEPDQGMSDLPAEPAPPLEPAVPGEPAPPQ